MSIVATNVLLQAHTEAILPRANEPLPTPRALKEQFGVSPHVERFIATSRAVVRRILRGEDRRVLVVVGPCSIHDSDSALEYGERLALLQKEVGEDLFLVMRTYFEKPRTTVGWKGYINDPFLDGSFSVGEGLSQARDLLCKLAERGLPTATEALDPVVQNYLSDLVSWTAIGARTVESQTHRELACSLPSPVGFKNATDGRIDVALDAIHAASRPHAFLGSDDEGRVCVRHGEGNPDCHIVLRGGHTPNYDRASVMKVEKMIRDQGITPSIMVDCSHANSKKDPERQPHILREVLEQRREGMAVTGIMIESHLHGGKQSLGSDGRGLKHGISITDSCLGWEATENILREAAEMVKW